MKVDVWPLSSSIVIEVFDGKVNGIIIPKENAVDIDDIYDFKYAESILENNHYENWKQNLLNLWM